MGKNVEDIIAEEEIRDPSTKLIEENARKNPLFQKLIDCLRPEEKSKFYTKFRDYLNNAYQNNPKLRRLMKTHDLSRRVEYIPEENEDPRKTLEEQMYAEPGRTYNYTNNFLGNSKNKKDMLYKTYSTAGGIAKETWPGLGAGIGWYALDRIYQKGSKKGILSRIKNSAKKTPLWMKILSPFSALKTGGDIALDEIKHQTWGAVRKPTIYLIAGYLLYKTVKYFVKKRKENRETLELEKMQGLQRSIGLQNQTLYEMAA